MTNVLAVSDLHYTVGKRRLFNGLSLTLEAGDSVAVLGPSGSGKSTLLACVLGLVRPKAGSIRVSDTEVTELSDRRLARLRSSTIGMVFQFGELIPELTPLENIELAGMMNRSDSSNVAERAIKLLKELGVRTDGPCIELSGGERQRVAVARALVNSPKLLLADEPTGALDAKRRIKTAEILFRMPKKHGCGLLVVTHDLQVAALADRVFEICDGLLLPADVIGGGSA